VASRALENESRCHSARWRVSYKLHLPWRRMAVRTCALVGLAPCSHSFSTVNADGILQCGQKRPAPRLVMWLVRHCRHNS
jgi:hypothetical protein